jgi:Alpha/beta hydrolase domain
MKINQGGFAMDEFPELSSCPQVVATLSGVPVGEICVHRKYVPFRIHTFLAVATAIAMSLFLNTGLALAGAPTISGPIAGAPAVVATTTFDLSEIGYQQAEFFMSGTASSYTPTAALDTDGYWRVTPSATAAYTTRVIVYRPTDPHLFNGTVYVEWLNVTVGSDFAADWLYSHDEVIKEGAAYVLISAQQVGVNAAVAADPARYGSLSHPGDSFSYDIYSQAGEALKRDAATLLGGLKIRQMIAVGESQSADRLVTYIDAVQPLARLYQGFLVHSYIAAAAPLSQSPQADVPAPVGTLFRTDQVPVLDFQTETDASSQPANVNLQRDDRLLRIWNVTGAAHADAYLLDNSFTDIGDPFTTAQDVFSSMLNPSPVTILGTCSAPIDSGPDFYVINAAFGHINKWVESGFPPRSAPRFEYTSLSPATFAQDSNGNVLGGIRTPFVDVPVARLSGVAAEGAPGLCILFGSTTPFSQPQLAGLYPSHNDFVWRFALATVRSAEEGWVLPEEVPALINAAVQATTVP